jgi:putative hemolysin
MDVFVGLTILGAAIVFYAVVNSIEIAVVGANRIRMRHLAESGSKAAQALERLHRRQERFFAAIVLLQNITVVLASSMGALIASDIAGNAGVFFATIIVAILTTLFGELTPKILAAHSGDRYALFVALPAQALTSVLGPIVLALGYFPGLLSRLLFGVRLEAGPSVSEAELRMLIDISAQSGTMEEAEAELLDRVFHFGDRRVHEVMVPRTEAVGVERRATIADFFVIYAESLHSRFPLFDESPDKVVGILGIKDVLAGLATGHVTSDSPIEPLARPAYFVPETKLIGELFREMQAAGTQMAIAVDEWGGTAGIVTLEQLLEEMVGQVRDELGLAEVEVRPIDEHTFQVDGGLSVEEARDEVGIDIPEGDYDTIAGYVLSELGHIPKVGESVTVGPYRIIVSEMRGLKVEMLRVTRT